MSLFDGLVHAKVFSLLQFSATTNETASLGTDISTAVMAFFPSMQDADIETLIAVCKPMLRILASDLNVKSSYSGLSVIVLLFLGSSVPNHYRRH